MKKFFLFTFLFTSTLQAKTLTADIVVNPPFKTEHLHIQIDLETVPQPTAAISQTELSDDGHQSFCFHQLIFGVGTQTTMVTHQENKEITVVTDPIEAIYNYSNEPQTCEPIPYLFAGLQKMAWLKLASPQMIPTSIQPPPGYEKVYLTLSLSGRDLQSPLDIDSHDGLLYFTRAENILEQSNLEPAVQYGLRLLYKAEARRADGDLLTLGQGSAPLQIK